MKKILERILGGATLSADESKSLMLSISQGQYSDIQIASLLTCLKMRGVTTQEIIGFREALMETRIPVDFAPYKPIDIVGTGGDGKNTFNISTCACFVVAGAGYKVAKHGNYAATSVSGASTVMERHGVKFTNDVRTLYRSIEECGMAYLHAPLFNPAMKAVAAVRKALQFPTIFNLLGPIINPCKPQYQLLGVANLQQLRLYTDVLSQLGIGYSVINSVDGYDEVSLTGDFKLVSTDHESICGPEDFGMWKLDPAMLSGGDTPEEAADIFDMVIGLKSSQGHEAENAARRDVVIANAAVAISTICPEKSLGACVDEARDSLLGCKARQCFEKFVKINS